MKRGGYLFLLAILFVGALTVRTTDLTDQPLEFNPTRQLFNAIRARAIYYSWIADEAPEKAALAAAHVEELERLEPPFVETIAAAGYRLAGRETPWIGRLVSIAAWLACGWIVVRIGRKLGAGEAGILPGVAYFLFLPLGIYAGRAFMVDPLMIFTFGLSFDLLLGWMESPRWKWTVLTGLAGGLAVLLKGVGAFILGPVFAVAVWIAAGRDEIGLRERVIRLVRDPQIWAMFLLVVGPALLYYPGVAAETGSLYTRSGIYRIDDILSPSFYIRWLILLDGLLHFPVLLAAFAGAWLAPPGKRAVLLAFWAGYALYGLAFPKLISTHDYYQLPLILIAAISLIPTADLVGKRLMETGGPGRAVFAGLLLAAFYPAWLARSVLLAEDFREAGAYWALVGEEIPADARAVGYTQDYGFRLMYYGWRAIGVLPEGIDADEFESRYASADYFVITAKNPMSDDLADHLARTYPVLAAGGGYTIYDLQP